MLSRLHLELFGSVQNKSVLLELLLFPTQFISGYSCAVQHNVLQRSALPDVKCVVIQGRSERAQRRWRLECYSFEQTGKSSAVNAVCPIANCRILVTECYVMIYI